MACMTSRWSRPRAIRSTRRCSLDPATTRSSSTCSSSTPAMSGCTRCSTNPSARTGRPCSRCGARTTRFSCLLAPRRSSAIIRVRSSVSSTRGTSRWKHTSQRLRPPSGASSCHKTVPAYWRTVMRAIVLEKFGGPESLVYKEIPDPQPEAGHVVIEIKAFGINHAEMHMRRGEWAEAAKVIGIECVGLVKSCPGGEFPVGAKVAALMGGLGRTINGSYAEYTKVRATNVALIESDLPWADLAAIPETYATAWTCLFRNLEIVQGQTLVIRGASSSFGQAALNMAVDAGVRVIATTRGAERVALLEKLGAERVETEGPDLSKRIAEAKKLDAVLDLVGNSTILDSLDMLRRGGRACLAGWLGGLAPIADFNPLLQMASGVYLTFFGSFVFGDSQFPLSDVPLQKIAEGVATGRLKAKPARIFRFEEIREAHRVMEANEAGGKMVVVRG